MNTSQLLLWVEMQKQHSLRVEGHSLNEHYDLPATPKLCVSKALEPLPIQDVNSLEQLNTEAKTNIRCKI